MEEVESVVTQLDAAGTYENDEVEGRGGTYHVASIGNIIFAAFRYAWRDDEPRNH